MMQVKVFTHQPNKNYTELTKTSSSQTVTLRELIKNTSYKISSTFLCSVKCVSIRPVKLSTSSLKRIVCVCGCVSDMSKHTQSTAK